MKYIPILLLLLGMLSCDDFLEYKDKDKLIPNELTHYDELIYGEILTKNLGVVGKNIELMTDDATDFIPSTIYETTSDKRKKYRSWYIWAKETQVDEEGSETIDNAWEYFYHAILMCNVVEHEVGMFEDDIDGVKYRLLGEVQCMRAIFYWYLAGMYGAPYRDPEVAKTAMGVPINKEIGIKDKLYERSTLQEVYELMKTDLLASIDNFQKGEKKNTIFRPTEEVAKLFLTRIYLAERNYEEVIAICNDVLGNTAASITSLDLIKTYSEWGSVNLYNKSNPGILFTWMDRYSWDDFFPGYDICYRPSDDLMRLFNENSNDVRKTGYLTSSKPIKHMYDKTAYGLCYRVEEFYFNRAEAYIETGEYELGMNDINQVRLNRIDDADYKLNANNIEEARAQFRNEKRREFCFEDMRWYDMKRWGVRVVHQYHEIQNSTAYTEYVLEADSPNYILPLPLDVQRRNTKIEKPERVDTQIK